MGGDINFETGRVTARGGNIQLGGLSAVGTVGLSDDGFLNFPEDVERADITLSNTAEVDVNKKRPHTIISEDGSVAAFFPEFGDHDLP